MRTINYFLYFTLQLVILSVAATSVLPKCPVPTEMGIVNPIDGQWYEWYYDKEQVLNDCFSLHVPLKIFEIAGSSWRSFNNQTLRFSDRVARSGHEYILHWTYSIGANNPRKMDVAYKIGEVENLDNVFMRMKRIDPDFLDDRSQQWFILAQSEDQKYILVYVCTDRIKHTDNGGSEISFESIVDKGDKSHFEGAFIVGFSSAPRSIPIKTRKFFDAVLKYAKVGLLIDDFIPVI